MRKLKIADNEKRIAEVKTVKIRAAAIAKGEMEAKALKRKIAKANAKTQGLHKQVTKLKHKQQ